MFPLKTFLKTEDGNATVDWVVLTAGLVMLGLSVGLTVSGSAMGLAGEINTATGSVSP